MKKTPNLIEGYASVFNIPDQEGDIVQPGAFQDFLTNRPSDIPVLWQHYPNILIGKLIDAQEDTYGLKVKLEICTEIQAGREAFDLITCGILKGLSIGFNVLKAVRGPARIKRILKKLELKEISVVTFPAHQKALITGIQKNVAHL